MPFPSLNKAARRRGIQTHAVANKLPAPLKEVELEYLSLRDWYSNQLAIKAQFEEALAQAKSEGNVENVAYFRARLHGCDGRLKGFKEKVRQAGSLAWCEAYAIVCENLLDLETRKILQTETDKLLGRTHYEFRKGT